MAAACNGVANPSASVGPNSTRDDAGAVVDHVTDALVSSGTATMSLMNPGNGLATTPKCDPTVRSLPESATALDALIRTAEPVGDCIDIVDEPPPSMLIASWAPTSNIQAPVS